MDFVADHELTDEIKCWSTIFHTTLFSIGRFLCHKFIHPWNFNFYLILQKLMPTKLSIKLQFVKTRCGKNVNIVVLLDNMINLPESFPANNSSHMILLLNFNSNSWIRSVTVLSEVAKTQLWQVCWGTEHYTQYKKCMFKVNDLNFNDLFHCFHGKCCLTLHIKHLIAPLTTSIAHITTNSNVC